LKSYRVRTYQTSDYAFWNEFVAQSKNATFLFHRDFMEYHSDRFQDYSLLIFDEKDKLKAILPANRVGDNLYSHQGLTYGGLVISASTMLFEVIQINQVMLSFLYEQQILKLHLKIIPTIYNNIPSDEMEYISFLLHAKLYRRDAIAILDITNQVEKSRVRKRGIEKGLKNNLVIKEVDDFKIFWNELLIPNLKERYNVSPVHTLEEIKYLKLKFPTKIKQYNVIHPQYIAGNKDFNNLYGGLDFLYDYLINNVYRGSKYFDFGISNENNGLQLNEKLHYWKESFGARTVVQNFYEIETKNYKLLENVFI
jgi:hypothetical protein